MEGQLVKVTKVPAHTGPVGDSVIVTFTGIARTVMVMTFEGEGFTVAQDNWEFIRH